MMKTMRKKRLLFAAIGLVLLLALAVGIGYLQSISSYKNAIENFAFREIEISGLPDGAYTGECDVNVLYAKVEVTVQGGKLKSIRLLEHKNDRGAAAEPIVDRMVEEQRVDVDAVAGATNSSKVIRMAVEDALTR